MDTPQPHYQKLKQYILARITGGDWPAYTRIPSEGDLVREFGISRMTVNRALRELASAGVITRVQGVGSFVAGQKAESAMFEVRSIRDEVRGRGQVHSVEVLDCQTVPADETLARQFGVPVGSTLFHSRLLHRADDQPLQLEDRYVNPVLAPGYLALDFQVEIPHHYLMRVAPLERAEHAVEAEAPTRALVRLMTLAEGEPLLVLSRRTWSRGQVASVARLIHPASRYRLIGTFQVGDMPA